MTAPPPPIWVINLERASERREFMRGQLEALGLPYEFLTAVDGHQLGSRARHEYSRVRAVLELGRQMTAPEIGCALSHLAAYERLLAEDLEEALILEDDVELGGDVPAVLDARGGLPADWDLVTLYHGQRARPVPFGPSFVAGRRFCTFERVWGTQGYLVRRSAAERLMCLGRPVRLPSDELLYRPGEARLRVYGVTPPALRPAAFESHLLEEVRERRAARGRAPRAVSRGYRAVRQRLPRRAWRREDPSVPHRDRGDAG